MKQNINTFHFLVDLYPLLTQLLLRKCFIICRYKDLSANTTVPEAWQQVSNSKCDEGFQLCTVSKISHEYTTVEAKFTETMPHVTIISVDRVQNMELWDDFCRQVVFPQIILLLVCI